MEDCYGYAEGMVRLAASLTSGGYSWEWVVDPIVGAIAAALKHAPSDSWSCEEEKFVLLTLLMELQTDHLNDHYDPTRHFKITFFEEN